MSVNKTPSNQIVGFKHLYTALGLVLGVALGSLLYAITGHMAYLVVTAAFGLVAGAGADQDYEGPDCPGQTPFK